MRSTAHEYPFAQTRSVSRRELLAMSLAAGATGALTGALTGVTQANEQATTAKPADARRSSPKRYKMRKSINLWAFPYPQRMTLLECLELAKRAGFDAIELNYDLDNDLSPKASPSDLANIRKMADKVGIEISGFVPSCFGPIRSAAMTQPNARVALNSLD